MEGAGGREGRRSRRREKGRGRIKTYRFGHLCIHTSATHSTTILHTFEENQFFSLASASEPGNLL